LLYKTRYLEILYKVTLLLVLISLNACHFEPVYKNKNIISELCSIKVKEIKPGSQLYEINFKNELQYILCDKKKVNYKYLLDWNIERSLKELIKSESNMTRRFEESFLIKFNILDISNNIIIYSDEIVSKGAYNVHEDAIIGTKASKESLGYHIPINSARLVLDNIYLFMRKNEN